MLRELPLTGGTITTNGSISYCSQQAWLFDATIRGNILFGSTYDKEKYTRVIEASALNEVIHDACYVINILLNNIIVASTISTVYILYP